MNYNKLYYQEHKEEIKQKSRDYRNLHKEEIYRKRKEAVLAKYSNIKVEDLEGEIWRDIPNCDGYQISNLGRVKSLDYKGFHYEKILKLSPRCKNKGKVVYYWVCIKKWYPVHKLIALAFPDVCGEYFEGAEISHKNAESTDNRPENIEWVTHRGNMNNPITKERNKASQKVKVFTEEHKKHLSEAKKKWWANR